MKSAAISVALFCACGAFAGGSRQFPLGEVELTGSVFLERRDVDEKYLLEVVDADRLPEGEGNDHQDYGAGIGAKRGETDYASDAWKDCVAWASKEAARLGLELSLHNSPGYSACGGPWIRPRSR